MRNVRPAVLKAVGVPLSGRVRDGRSVYRDRSEM